MYTTVEGVITERGGVYLLPCILVTAPVFHLDTSELNAYARKNTAREGATKKRKDQPTTNNKKRVPFQKHKNKNNNTYENCDPIKLEGPLIQIYNNGKGMAT